jgi:hypothetical protein
LVALASIAPAHAQTKPGAKPAAAAKPAAQPAKPAAQPAKPAAAKPDPKAAAKPDPKAAAKPDPKAAVKTGLTKPVCATEPKKGLADAKKKDEAKKAFGEGKKLIDKPDYENAHICFKLADAYVPGAQPKYRIAASLDKMGKVAEAVAAYDAFLAFVGPSPDDKFKEIVADAKTRNDALKQTPSKVKVAVSPAGLPNQKIMVDGAAQPGPELTLAPGKHTLTISADGYETSTQPLEIGFAETRDVNVTLNKAPEVVPTATAVATATSVPTASETAVATAPPTATATAPVEKSNIPAYVTLGLAGAGAVVGGIFGGLALASKGEFDSMVAGPHDPKAATDKADETDRNALIADMSFAVALTFGVTGAVLLLTDTGATTSTPPAKTGAKPAPKKASLPRSFIAPYASPTGAGAAARFTF